MLYLIITVLLTLSVSAMCSMLEAMILGTTPVEIETLKTKSRRKGELLEMMVRNIDETTSAILTTNTIANTFGATLSGAMFAAIFGTGFYTSYVFPACLTVAILFFSEILPKNLGIIYRPHLHSFIVFPLSWLGVIMLPVSRFTRWTLRRITSKSKSNSISDDEIILLAKKGEEDGLLSSQERDLITNSLELDDVAISEIMTPRTVLMALDEDMTIGEVFEKYPHIGFSRIPVYKDAIDNITGVVRRRDILTAKANDLDSKRISTLKSPAIFVPENGSALSVLKQLIKKHQQIGIVVDEFSSLTGVISLEDIFEKLLGSEIFDTDDVAVDMRELARHRRAGNKSIRQGK